MEIAAAWIIFSVVVAVIAESRHRSRAGWFFLSLILSPLIGLILAVALPSLKPPPGTPTPETHVRCPDCAELVLNEAKVCKHCGCRLTPTTA